MLILSILFFVTAILYSSVGFGGGSTYLALLLIWGIPYYIFPVIALLCNIIVVSGNSYNYVRAGNYNYKLLTPFLIGSIPFAFFGGTLKIDKEIFEILLFIVLSSAGILLLINNKSYDAKSLIVRKLNFFISLLIGSFLGLISGIVGIGGGIFLSPILFLFKAEKPKVIVTTASLFILINSIKVQGSLQRKCDKWFVSLLATFFKCFNGGYIGNYINLKFCLMTLAIVKSLLVIFVSIRIGIKIFI